MKRLVVTADTTIPVGSPVLVRGRRAVAATDALANATACPRPSWDWSDADAYAPGDTLPVEMFDGLGNRDLHAIANGPIMDPSELYLPAGKLSMAEYRAREARRMAGEAA